MLGQIIICILVADFLSGTFHWFEDTYGLPGNSWLAKNIWEPNILHHKFPLLMEMTTFIGRNYIQWVVAAIVVILMYSVGWGSWQLILVAVLASFSNEVHKWNHAKVNCRLVVLLQDMCLIQTKLHHSKHHLKPYNKNYCILTNWVNPPLEMVDFWRHLEWALSPILRVKRGNPLRDGY